jgi:universal stress protein A
MKYERILAAIELSTDAAAIVAKKSFELAHLFAAELFLLHIIKPLPASKYVFSDTVSIEENMAVEAKNQLTELAKEHDMPMSNQLVKRGLVKLEITRIAKERNVDLIIVGSHGQHGFIENLLGSTANAVLQSAKCDVLVVRTNIV